MTMLGYESANTKQRTQAPSLLDIAWAAGFIEGEGSFGRGRAQICVAQVQREPLERLLKFFGGRIVITKEAYGNHNRKYRWMAAGMRARGIMLTIYTFMSPKRRQQIRNSINTSKHSRLRRVS